MNPREPERHHVGELVKAQIDEMGFSVPEFAQRVGVNATTLRRFLRGTTWMTPVNRRRLNDALGWPQGEIARLASPRTPAEMTPRELVRNAITFLTELDRRIELGEIQIKS